MFTPNLVIGLAIMGLGSALLLDRLGVADASELLKYWPVLLVLFGASIAVQALRPRDPSVPPQRPVIAPGFVLFVVLIAMLMSSGFRANWAESRETGDERINLFGVMGSARRTSTSTNFTGAQMGGVMGRSTLDLRQATIPAGEEAVVNVFVAMGRATVLVPEGWEVDTTALPVMGAVDDERWPGGRSESDPAVPATGPPPRLVLRGFVLMGKVEIRS